MSNSELLQAKRNKDDEFYTKYDDIARELEHWKHRLSGKRIICCCDSAESNFVKFLNDNKEAWNIKSVDYSCLPVSMFDIDYSNYDLVITNPPFSKYNDILDLFIGKIDFILLAPGNLLWRKRFKTAYNNHKIFLGFGRGLPLSFINTDKKVFCDWITSFDDYNITTRNYEADNWTLLPVSALRYISTYDYETEYAASAKINPKVNAFKFYIKKVKKDTKKVE